MKFRRDDSVTRRTLGRSRRSTGKRMKQEDVVEVQRPYHKAVEVVRQDSLNSLQGGKDDGDVKKPCHKAVEVIRQDSQRSNANSVGKVSVDFDTAMEQAGYGKFNYFLLLIAFPATCTSCFDTTALSFVLPVAGCDLQLTSVQYGVLNSAAYGGMICSSFLWGYLSDTYGRQKLLTWGYLLDALMVVLSGFSPSFWWMAFFRFASGFMICGPYSIFMTYLAEVFNSKHRDWAVISAGLYYSIGSILQPALALTIVPLEISVDLPFNLQLTSWRVFLIVCALPSLIAGLGTAFCVESPKFLLDKGRKEEALDVFRKIYTINTGHAANTYPVRRLHRESIGGGRGLGAVEGGGKAWQTVKAVLWQATALFRPPHLTNALYAFSLNFGLVAVLNVVRLWMPQLFAEMMNPGSEVAEGQTVTLCSLLTAEQEAVVNENCREVDISAGIYLNIMVIYGACFISNCLSNILMRLLGKKVILVSTVGLPAVCILLISLLPTGYVLPLASIYISLLNAYFYVLISYVVELFPTHLRATGVSLTMMFGRVGIFITTLALTKLLYIQCDLVFYLLGSILIVMTIASVFMPSPQSEAEKAQEQKNNDNAA